MRHSAKTLVTPLLILIYWQLIASSGLVSVYLVPPPLKVWQAAQELLASGVLTKSIATSLARVLSGFAISCVLAFLLALLVNASKTIDQLLAAPLALLRMIPPLAMTPLLILWFGIGSTTQLSIIVLGSIFPVLMSTRDGLQRVNPQFKELAQTLRLSPLRYFFAVVLPSATPSIVTGLRTGFGYSWRSLIGAELIAAASGLGHLIIDAQEMMRTDDVMVGILTIGLIGWLLDTLFYQGVCKRLARRFPEICN